MNKTILAAVVMAAISTSVMAYPSARHPQIFQSTSCVAQWVDLPGPRVWFTGFIKNTGSEGAMGPMFKIGKRTTWWGDPSFELAAAALHQLQKSCPEVEVAG